MELKGKLICAMGIPACGKSSVIRELATISGIETAAYFEPEENDSKFPWPKAVSMRQKYGYFGSITWFRSMRVPMLFDASEAASAGKLALVDSYYDKLLYNYIGKDGLDWFLPRDDSYYSIVEAMAKKDYESLPEADLIICFTISESLWRQFLSHRGRNMDKELDFMRICFSLQEHMINACRKYANDYGKPVLFFKQINSSPLDVAQKLKDLIEDIS